MNDVWIFREPRVGGTAFSNLLATKLNKISIFVEQAGYKINPPSLNNTLYNVKHPLHCADSLYSTHDFEHLRYMNLYKDPFLIHVYRQNKVEQCFSRLISEWMLISKFKYIDRKSIWFFNNFSDNSNSELLNMYNNLEPTILTKDRVYQTLTDMKRSEILWHQHSLNHKFIEISYEELCLGVDIPELGLYGLSIDETSRTQKLPSIHKQIFLNYEMIVQWITEFYNS